MNATHPSLLVRAQGGDGGAWHDLVDLYRPLVVGWVRAAGVPPAEWDDLVQDILLSVVQSLGGFAHSGRLGAFRTWLRTIARHRTCDFWRGRGRTAAAAADAADALRRLEAPDSGLDRRWDEEHDLHVLGCLLRAVEGEFEPRTIRAFRRTALDGAAGDVVAAELGLSVGAVYMAKVRVLQRVRAAAAGLLDD